MSCSFVVLSVLRVRVRVRAEINQLTQLGSEKSHRIEALERQLAEEQDRSVRESKAAVGRGEREGECERDAG